MVSVQLKKHRHRFAREKSCRHCEWAQELHRSGQAHCCGCGWLASRYQVDPGEETAVQRLPRCIREEVGGLTLRAEEVGSRRTFVDTKHIELERWGPPLVDADWHAFCQAIYKGSEGKEWEALHCHFRKLHQATGNKKPSDSQNAEAF